MKSIRLRPCAVALACLAAFAGPAWAANSGGSTGTACGPFYVGTCATSGDAVGGRVFVDTEPGDGAVGGFSVSDDAYRNTVIVGGNDTFLKTLVGGYGNIAHSNTIMIGGNAVLTANVVGGGGGPGGQAFNNQIIVGDHTSFSTDLIGGSGEALARGNTVLVQGQASGNHANTYGGMSLNNATANQVIIGGQATLLDSGIAGGITILNGPASYNQVVIRDQAHLSNVQIYGGGAFGTDMATGNQIILGGQSQVLGSASVIAGGSTAGDGEASGNIVTIQGTATVEGNVVGGSSTGAGAVHDNRVILQGAPTLSQARLYGGVSLTGAASSNTLEVRSVGLKAINATAFDTYQFLLPQGVHDGATVLELTEAGGTAIGDAKAQVSMASGADALHQGAKVMLLKNANGLTSSAYSATPAQVTAHQGFALDYQLGITNDGSSLTATVQNVQVNEASKAPVESRASMLALANQGGDLAAGLGMNRARSAATAGDWAAFGAVAGGHSRYESGSHVTVDGVSLMAGVARRFAPGAGELTVGPFIEAGYGSHDSSNDFSGQSVRGSGNSHYVGAGVLASIDFDRATPGLGVYAEASLRAGRLDSDWSSNDLQGAAGQSASYDSAVSYVGAHLGAGYRLPIGQRSKADLYAKYFWTRLGSDSADVAGAPYDFKATNSSRTRLGARFIHAYSDQTQAWAGAAWDHEFDGQARAAVYGFDTPSPSLKGDSGVFELGLNVTPSSRKALSIDIGLQAYVGKRQGFGGAAALKYAF